MKTGTEKHPPIAVMVEHLESGPWLWRIEYRQSVWGGYCSTRSDAWMVAAQTLVPLLRVVRCLSDPNHSPIADAILGHPRASGAKWHRDA